MDILLKEFRLGKTKFGQLALGIGVFDIFEILALAGIIALPAFISGGSKGRHRKSHSPSSFR